MHSIIAARHDDGVGDERDPHRTTYIAEQRRIHAEQRAIRAEDRAEAAERRIADLEYALDSRAPIDQAKGVLMGVFDLEPEPAFQALAWVSQHANIKLATIAERFLADVRHTEFGGRLREEVTRVLAAQGRRRGPHLP
ncbi:ANTAR domain-containing protein [Actinomycetospora endophytica]|uniref:ANTAR domain-containing protein n=1 Tax=Actinomycetospora endophytica TaxID=2291215 RepID=A0ABS8PDD1_9PSEU|nr:ANTAR domain-containing protein [Actinomycetospora endophytica]MCD2196272.1 ANTAR domain-containing protein [Actinomycetospora endophytica]